MPCSVKDVLAELDSQPNLSTFLLWKATYGVLCRILNAFEPMADCSVKESMAQLGCCDDSSPFGMLKAIFGKLCQVLTAIETGGIISQTCITCSDVDPVAASVCPCAFHMNRAQSTLWYWDSNDNAWYKFG